MKCPLCSFSTHYLVSGEHREYWLCSNCQAITVPANFHITQEEEVKRYLKHENSLENEGYVQMFQEKIDILKAYEIRSALDYGCGYEPVLKTLLERQGIKVDVYDLNFFPDISRGKLYDLVISTETFEHFRNPSEEISRISEKIVKGGILAIMTQFYPDDDKAFADWYYKNDPTHIIFYCPKTFQWIAERKGFKLIFNNGYDFVLLRKHIS